MINLKYKKIQCKGIITSVIDNLQLTDVKVVFDDKQVLAHNLCTHAQIAFLNAIDDDNERAAYEKKSEEEKSSYITQSPRIHFPDLSVQEFIELFENIQKIFKTEYARCVFFDNSLIFAIQTNKNWFELGGIFGKLNDKKRTKEIFKIFSIVCKIADYINNKGI